MKFNHSIYREKNTNALDTLEGEFEGAFSFFHYSLPRKEAFDNLLEWSRRAEFHEPKIQSVKYPEACSGKILGFRFFGT